MSTNQKNINTLSIRKRDGSLVDFDKTKITRAIEMAMRSVGEKDTTIANNIATGITRKLVNKKKRDQTFFPTVEGVQDMVEEQLIRCQYPATAKAYILYRAEHARKRERYGEVPQRVRALAQESAKYFTDNPMGELVYLRTYARWIEKEGRRETWIETVDRYIDFMRENLGDKLTDGEYAEVRTAILKQEVMPSMRLMQFAGEPARRCNTCAYNCSFIAPTKLRDFSEIMYLSMQGCGVGFSVESRFVEQLPQIQRQVEQKKVPRHRVADSKEGWCEALEIGLKTWYEGNDVKFDYTLVRPSGARLHTMGGKASGPEPLRALLDFARESILSRQGRRLRTLDVHDIICKIGECVVSGGVRRTAMISLSDLDDRDLRRAKHGQFYLTEPQRTVANNSAVYEDTPTNTELLDEWLALMKSGSGERGIFNRGSLSKTIPQRRLDYFKERGFLDGNGMVHGPIGTNPCGEILLQSKQFCNLSEVIARSNDTREDLVRKIKIATILGTYQSTLTNFNYISKEWLENCQAERLLGVSITGQWDCAAARDAGTLLELRETAVQTNKEYASRFGVNQSTSVTAVKPSGTVSQTLNCSSGIHPRHAPYYIRRIRISATDSLFSLLKDQGVPHHPEVGQSPDTATTYVLEFPVKSPEETACKDDLTALDQLEYWKRVKQNYTEHNPSATISVGRDEWIEVINWLQKNWDMVGGLSFLPRFDHVYQLAPYEPINKERYEKLMQNFPILDFSKLVMYEHSDETEQKRELACAGGLCEIDAISSPEASR